MLAVSLPLGVLEDLLPLSNPLQEIARGKKRMLVELLEAQIERGVLRRFGSGRPCDPFEYAWTIPEFSSSWTPSKEAHDEGLARLLDRARERGLL